MAVDANAIITLADLKATLGISVSTYDTMLEQAIDAATHQIESWLDRKVVQRRFYEWTSTGGQPHITLRNPPIGHVHYIGVGQMSAMTLSSTVSTDISCTVSLVEGRMTLVRVDSSGNETISQIQFANHKTSSALVTHINTLTGWQASLVTNCRAEHLHRFAGRDVINATLTMTFADHAQMDTRVDNDRGIVYLSPSAYGDDPAGWPRGPLTMLVDYDGGWETVPYDIEQACRLLAAGIFYSRARDTSIVSESLGDYSYTLDSRQDSDREAYRLLYPYRRIR